MFCIVQLAIELVTRKYAVLALFAFFFLCVICALLRDVNLETSKFKLTITDKHKRV